MSKAILNLGAGKRIIEGAHNVDKTKHSAAIDETWDLNDLPWPWADASYDVIAGIAVFEHLRIDLYDVMDECWRILRPGGRVVVKLPYWRSDISYQDPGHYWRGFSLQSMHFFDRSTKLGKAYAFYGQRPWKIIKGPRLNRSRSSIWITLQVVKGKA